MTARVLGRWAHLLLRCPQSCAAASCIHAPVAQLAGALGPRAWVRPVSHRQTEEEPKATFKPTKLDKHLLKVGTPQEVLQMWAELDGSANQAGICLHHLSQMVAHKDGAHSAEILQDPRCEDMLKTVNSQMSSVWNGTLVSLLHSLTNLGLAPSSPVLRSIQMEALWRIRRFSSRQLSYLASWALRTHDQGQADAALCTAVLKQLELRWTELDNPRVITILMAQPGALSPSFMDKLEDKALELAEMFSAEDIRRMAVALANQGRRVVPILRALSFHLHQKPSSELKTPLLLDIAFAYGKLNFHHPQVFQRMALELLSQLPQMSPAEVVRCSKSLAILKWLHLPLFEGFALHFLRSNYSSLQLCNLLLSFARLNFQPTNREQFYKKVHEVLEGSWQSLEAFLLTDVIWSLCVLQQAKPQYITAVTDSNFQTNLTDTNAVRLENYRLKVLHIAASGQLEPLGASGAPHTPTALPSVPVKAFTPTDLQDSLHTAVRSLAENRTTAFRTHVSTVYGWPIDAELVLDAENKPIDLENLVAPHLPGGGGAKVLPQGAHRMAFLVWEFPHFCFKSKDLLGRFAMQKRHLQLAGFLVVEVPYFEWLELKSDWQRVAYLKGKMGKVVAEAMAK